MTVYLCIMMILRIIHFCFPGCFCKLLYYALFFYFSDDKSHFEDWKVVINGPNAIEGNLMISHFEHCELEQCWSKYFMSTLVKGIWKFSKATETWITIIMIIIIIIKTYSKSTLHNLKAEISFESGIDFGISVITMQSTKTSRYNNNNRIIE